MPTLPMVPGVRLPQVHCEQVIITRLVFFCFVLVEQLLSVGVYSQTHTVDNLKAFC